MSIVDGVVWEGLPEEVTFELRAAGRRGRSWEDLEGGEERRCQGEEGVRVGPASRPPGGRRLQGQEPGPAGRGRRGKSALRGRVPVRGGPEWGAGGPDPCDPPGGHTLPPHAPCLKRPYLWSQAPAFPGLLSVRHLGTLADSPQAAPGTCPLPVGSLCISPRTLVLAALTPHRPGAQEALSSASTRERGREGQEVAGSLARGSPGGPASSGGSSRGGGGRGGLQEATHRPAWHVGLRAPQAWPGCRLGALPGPGKPCMLPNHPGPGLPTCPRPAPAPFLSEERRAAR